ncbi:uncharacterized protein LOC131738144 [Acipenser ruthenus]|uniref:uncharacterized protein LOC131738144 n=1 Tax=Acipenser ruthenus TaxID=7906 RepID=UPI002740AE94|nr:uncharacterized protein LOC131738144 [Acipenser ruthenus]
MEDLQVAKRAIERWPAVLQYIDSQKKLPKSKVPTSVSCTLVKEAAADPLFKAKLHFFAFVARQLKPFLETFQTDAPMVPFLAEELQSTLMILLSCFIKRDVLENTKTVLQMLKLDALDKTLHVPLKQLDIGFATKQALDKASQKLQANALRGQEFKKECITFLATTSKKLLERSPLMYPVVRLLSSLDLVENLKERSLISLCLVQDSLVGRPMEDAIPKALVQHAKAARMRYVQYLENEKKKKVATENDRKRKELMSDIAHQTAKRQKIINSIEVMQREAD